MMTNSIILSLCILLLLAYVFDLTSSKTKVPSVILLLTIGWIVKQLTVSLNIQIPNLMPLLPVLGTVGLVLIVLEGSLEIELNKSKLKLVRNSAIVALLPMIIFSVGLAFTFQYYGLTTFKIGLANAIPLAIISSAIAIPSAQNFNKQEKEWITYESSFSDIFGVIFFNFITLNDSFSTETFGGFFLEIIVVLLVSFISTLVLAFLLSKINHHIKFIPIIIMVILIYTISKIYHLPALIFIMLFGLFMDNLEELKEIKFIQKIQPNILENEVHKFKELTAEVTFLIRVLFFMLFGFLIETNDLLNSNTIFWAVGICTAILIIRYIFLKIFKLNIKPLLFIAPRGLITILLFLSIPSDQYLSLANKSLIIQVIIISAFIMMIGSVTNKVEQVPEINQEQ